MAFNGSGVFNRLYSWVNDAASGIKIRADRMDNEMNGFATGLSNCVTKDGQTTVTANLPMAGFRHTGVGNATSRTDYASFSQVQDGNAAWADAGGTADAITASYSIPITALVDGQLCFVRASAANATTTPTFSPNGLTARTIVKNGGSALAIGDIAGNGHELILRYDLVGTRWELLNPRPPVVPNIPYTAASAAGPSTLDFFEDTDNGTNKVTLRGPTSIGSDTTLQLPSTGTLATLAGVETYTNKKLSDSTCTFVDEADATKQLAFQCSGITTATTRTVTVPNKDGTMAMTSDLLTSMTAVTASGTSVDFTGIPSTAKRVTIMFSGLSTNGSSNYQIQLGSGSIETSGYTGSIFPSGGSASQNSAAFLVATSMTSTSGLVGTMILTLMSSNTWVMFGNFARTDAAQVFDAAGAKALSGALDRIRVTTAGGTDTFDSGTINVFYE